MTKPTIYCSFCGKSSDETACIIAGPAVYICNECVELTLDIFRDRGVVVQYPDLSENDKVTRDQLLAMARNQSNPLVRVLVQELEQVSKELEQTAAELKKVKQESFAHLNELTAEF